MKVDRSRVLEYLRGHGRDGDVDAVRGALPDVVDTDRHRAALEQFGVDPDELLDGLGQGGLGRMIGG